MNAFKPVILLLALILELVRIEAGETNYFLVGELSDRVTPNDSYVLTLSRPEYIEYARYLIIRNELGFVEGDKTIVVANIGPGRDSVNRDYLDPTFPEWSWHVTEFFDQVTAEILGDWPTGLENGLVSGPTIGFWAYTVVRELGPMPLYLSAIPDEQNLLLFWSGTNVIYTLESKESFTGSDWAPLSGAPWPLTQPVERPRWRTASRCSVAPRRNRRSASTRSSARAHRHQQRSTELSIAANMKGLSPIILLIAILLQPFRIDAGETHYFLVAELPGQVLRNDSYVLPLSREDDMAHARYLISRVASGGLSAGDRPLVVARIIYAKDGINRNFRDPKFPEWSWHVVEFFGFGDITAEVLDGSPTQVEERNFTGGDAIGFWSYSVVRELGVTPLYVSVIPDGQAVQLYWSSLGTNYLYTLESKESLTGTDWTPVPDALWPLATNRWSVSVTNGPGCLYRVKAQESE